MSLDGYESHRGASCAVRVFQLAARAETEQADISAHLVANATDPGSENIVAVRPAERLEDFRFTFVGAGIARRIGMDIWGRRFVDIPNYNTYFEDCLGDFVNAAFGRSAVVTQRRVDFSIDWVIEYSRIIVPVIRGGATHQLLACYTFHDAVNDAKFF